MSEIIQQRSSIKFCVRNQISGAETFRMLQKAFGDNCMSRASVFDWYKLFKEGRQNVEDEPRPGWPSTPTDEQHVAKIKELVLQNRRLTTRELADMVGISNGSVNTIERSFVPEKSQISFGSNTYCTLHSFFVTISPKTQRISSRNHRIHLI